MTRLPQSFETNSSTVDMILKSTCSLSLRASLREDSEADEPVALLFPPFMYKPDIFLLDF